jgi:hypothetical protein
VLRRPNQEAWGERDMRTRGADDRSQENTVLVEQPEGKTFWQT